MAIAIIPARLGSTRLPGKPLLRDTGKFLIEHVVERARQARRLERMVVATDAPEIVAACRSFGVESVLTGEHRSGTDRVAEAARRLGLGASAELVVNVQGDEPELPPAHIDRLVELMQARPAPMGTLAEPLTDPEDMARPQVVKVVLDREGFALYFSRALIPSAPGPEAPALRHVGIYAFRPAFLETFTRLAPTPLERGERLEQLRALEHGHRIAVGVVAGSGARGVDTPEDYQAFVARWRRGAGGAA